MNFDFIHHKDASAGLIKSIAGLKQEHWPHPLDSQIKWIEENVSDEDIHLVLHNGESLIGYLSLSVVEISNGAKVEKMYGVGSVSVTKDFMGQNLGLLLMKLTDYYLAKTKTKGILLCKDNLVPFYQKCGWKIFGGEVYVANDRFQNHLMSTSEITDIRINISKLF